MDNASSNVNEYAPMHPPRLATVLHLIQLGHSVINSIIRTSTAGVELAGVTFKRRSRTFTSKRNIRRGRNESVIGAAVRDMVLTLTPEHGLISNHHHRNSDEEL